MKGTSIADEGIEEGSEDVLRRQRSDTGGGVPAGKKAHTTTQLRETRGIGGRSKDLRMFILLSYGFFIFVFELI
jgi:hypothetical protein